MLKQKIVFFIIFFVWLLFKSYSQVGVSQVSGCAPLAVTFTAPVGATSCTWNFGNGSAPSTNLVTSAAYSSPGNYVVTYSGVGGNPTSWSTQITVTSPTVVAAFSFIVPTSRCAPMSVSFTGSGGGAGSTYNWFFGDGGGVSGSSNSTTHVYTGGGIFTPTLNVIDAGGCSNLTTNGSVTVSTLPNLNIAALPGLSSCTAPFTTSFSGSLSTTGSPLGGSLTYNWTFGNSQSSTLQNPGSITYINQGIYNVKLIGTDNNNCTNTVSAVVTVVQPTLNATVPGTTCVNGQLLNSFQALSSTIQSSEPYTVWQMGDGNTVTVPQSPNPPLTPSTVHTFTYPLYTTPGLKTLTITATVGNCVATQIKTVFITKITPEFTWSPPTFTCMPNLAVTFVNQSTVNCSVALNYVWWISRWNGSSYSLTTTNATTVLTQGSLNPYAYYQQYLVAPNLTAYSAPQSGNVCFAGISHVTDSIWRPTAWFNKDKREGCAPLTVTFRDSSNYSYLAPRNYGITSYTWNNGANPATIVTGTCAATIPTTGLNSCQVFSPTFVYSAPGTYTPFYMIETSMGCKAKSFVDTIIVVGQPTVSYVSFPSRTVCVGTPVQFSLTASPSSSIIQNWHVETDDGFYFACMGDSMPSWPFNHVGVHNFTVSGINRGCKSEIYPPQTITVKGPVARASFTTNCTNKTSVDFGYFLQEVNSATLNFGDGASTTFTGSAMGAVSNTLTHVYPSGSGDYTATISGANSGNGCSIYTYTMQVKIRNIQAAFVVTNPIACKGEETNFNALASVDVYTTCSRGYAWLIDNLPTKQSSSYTIATNAIPDWILNNTPGTHTATLWVKDENSCTSTVSHTFLVGTPTASFNVLSPVCLSNMPLQFQNVTSQVPIATSNFTFSFGTGAVVTTSNVTNWPTYSYAPSPPGMTYVVTMTAQSAATQCTDVITKSVQVVNPQQLDLYPYKFTACIGVPIQFNVFQQGASGQSVLTNTINFGDGSPGYVSNLPTIAHTYSAAGVYTPLITTGSGPCLSTASSFSTIKVYSITISDFRFFPTLEGPSSTRTVFCANTNESITFSSTSTPNTGPVFSWTATSMGLPANTSTVSPELFAPASAGTHTVALRSYAADPECSTTITKTVTVLNPTATIVVDRNKICLGDTIHLSLKNLSEVFAWRWFIGDSAKLVYNTSASSPTIAYEPSFPNPFGSANVYLLYYGAALTCTVSDNFVLSVTKVAADFARNLEQAATDSIHCLNIADNFTNKTTLNNSTFLQSVFFAWKFGDGNTSSDSNPTNLFVKPGIYSVTLTAIEPLLGCKNIATKNMTINPIPDVSIAAIDSVCRGSTFVLTSITSTDVSGYQWNPVAGVSVPNSASTSVNASVTTGYSLQVLNLFGCKNTSNIEYVYVQPPAPTVRWDTTVIIGQMSVLNSNLGNNYSYTWSPIFDLNCVNCFNPTSTTTTNITYSVEVEDNLKCFRVINTYTVFVDPQTTIDVPSAFTPNGDGVNDVIYVDGWGIKKLNYFRIFNRWGQLLFESNDIKVGWDGTYNGVPQNMETYVYQVSAETYIQDKSLQKSSNFRLIR